MTRPDRGEYRSVYVVLLDGPDYQRLSPEARLVFLTLKLTAGSTGILVYPGLAHALAERTGYAPEKVAATLQELESAHGDWIQRDGNMVWVVRQLEFEPSLSRSNTHHRRWLATHLRGLPRRPIVARFRQRYADWFSEPEVVDGKGVPSSGTSTVDGMGDGRGVGTPHTMPITTTRDNHQRQPPETTTRPREGGMQVGYLTRCVVALNAGLRANPALPGFREVAASEQVDRVTWEADGIPVETAERVVAEVAAAYKPTPHNRQPGSLRYFDKAVRRAHELAGQPKGAAPPSANPFDAVLAKLDQEDARAAG